MKKYQYYIIEKIHGKWEIVKPISKEIEYFDYRRQYFAEKAPLSEMDLSDVIWYQNLRKNAEKIANEKGIKIYNNSLKEYLIENIKHLNEDNFDKVMRFVNSDKFGELSRGLSIGIIKDGEIWETPDGFDDEE